MSVSTEIAVPSDLGGRLRYLRESRGLRREHVACAVGKSVARVGGWETNTSAPHLTILRTLAQFFDVPFAFLIECEIVGDRR